MSGSRWMTTSLWLTQSLRAFLCIFSVYSWHLFLISSASVRSLLFLSFIVPVFAWIVPLVTPIFLEISSLSHSIVFLYFFALFTEEGFLISPCYSLELCIQLSMCFPFSIAFAHFNFSAICKASSDKHFAFCNSFSWGWFWRSAHENNKTDERNWRRHK